MHQKHIPEDWMRKKSWESKKMDNLFLLWQTVQQNCQEEATDSKNPLWGGESTGKRENLNREPHGVREEPQPKTKDDEGINKDFWAHEEAARISFIVIQWNREVQPTCETSIILYFEDSHIERNSSKGKCTMRERIGEKPKQEQIQVNYYCRERTQFCTPFTILHTKSFLWKDLKKKLVT